MVDTLVNFLNKTNYSKEDFLFLHTAIISINIGLHVGKNNNTQNEQRPKLINPFIHSQIFFSISSELFMYSKIIPSFHSKHQKCYFSSTHTLT